jgi:hypothetical protein
MARRGRCHCGHILQFQRGPEGFKVRCPQCGSVVRLQAVAPPAASEMPPVIDSSETFPALSAEMNTVPIVNVELVPLRPAPAKFWTPLQLLLLLAAALVALIVGALICWFVWMATSTP